ncbi:MAG: hypothetical protein OWT27_00560, partial [Firmicutes bacterium]|nr:hypothetical protein [Bacillota bacterium]
MNKLYGAVAILAISVWSSLAPADSAPAAADVSASDLANAIVTVHPLAIGTVPKLAYGMNTAVWDSHLFSATVTGRLRQLGIRMLRWPGGSYADTYEWNSNLPAFAAFMKLAQAIGATPMLTVNYGTGTPAEAAAWVKYVQTHHEHALWEIGNEQYGDGEYQGIRWEADDHADKSPAGYAKEALVYIAAMRKVDPRAQIGIDATIPGVWPAGIRPYWDRTVLAIVGHQINFVVIHWYPQNPGQESDPGLLAATRAIPGYSSRLQAYIRKYCGPHADRVHIMLDETNSVSSDPGKQTMSVVNALFLANDLNTWLEHGAADVSWWDLHNGPTKGNDSASLYGTANYGDYGILSAGAPSEPPLNTPTPSFWGYRLVHLFAQPGDTYVSAQSSQLAITAYAVRRGRAGTSVMLVNTSSHRSFRVHVRLPMSTPAARVVEFSYGEHSRAISVGEVRFGQGVFTLAPYSMAVLHILTPLRHARGLA